MKRYSFFLVVVLAVAANCQDKPRVFVQGKGSENVSSNGAGGGGHHWGTWGSKSTIDSHDEGMEVTKDLQKNCSGVTLTINDSNADYIVMLNRESKQNRGLLRSNSQIQVANKAGDVLGAKATHTVGNAAKDACNLILADWQEHAREEESAIIAGSEIVSSSGAWLRFSHRDQRAAVVGLGGATSEEITQLLDHDRQT